MRMLRSRFLDTWQPRVLRHVASRRAQSCYRYVETSLHGRLTVMDGQQRRVDVDDKTILLACTLYSSGAPESGYFIHDFHYVTDWSPYLETN